MSKKIIILALDEIQTRKEAIELVRKIGPDVYAVKIHNLYDKHGPSIVKALKKAGAEKVWVDFKFHDIPNTAKLRAQSVTADIVTVHASGGVKMMKAAIESGKEVFAVTVLTSSTSAEVEEIYNKNVETQVEVLAKMAKEAGVTKMVCSAKEVGMLSKNESLRGLEFIVPGIRSLGQDSHDQNRIGTPAEAIKDGANFLVIGRQITLAEDPVLALNSILEEIAVVA